MIIRKLKKLFLYLLNIPLYWISKLVPKDERIWLFGAWFGEKYADNSKYLFEYVNKNHPEIRAIWITKNKTVIEDLQKKGYEVYKRYSLKAIFHGIKAGCSIFVQSNGADNLLFLNNNKTKLVQLWHGIPLKKIGFDDKIYSYRKKNRKLLSKIINMLFPFLKEEYDLFIACSEEDKSKFASAFKSKHIVITGYPRNDIFFIKKEKKEKFIVTYLPTFRGNIGDEIDLFSDYNFDIEKWNSILSLNGIILNIKMHNVNKPKYELIKKIENIKNINFIEDVDIYDILTNTDILITDYSSVYFDFLLTNRPIIFAPFDYETYITKDRELYYDYNEVTPGPKCRNWDEVLEWILKFNENPNLYAKEREIIKNRFHKYQDGKSCERVYNEIIKLLNP